MKPKNLPYAVLSAGFTPEGFGSFGAEETMLQVARFSDKDMARLRAEGDKQPKAIRENPALKAAKERGIHLIETGRLIQIDPIPANFEELK